MIIKQEPEDFLVDEIPIAFSGSGAYLIVRATKRLLNTEELARVLAKAFGVPRKNVGYAGAKDKRAVTTQYLSLKGVSSEKVESFSHEKITLEAITRHDAPLSLGDLNGNTFVIVVRGLAEPLKKVESFRNYFGEQRFGEQNDVIGRCLVKKDFAKAARLLGLSRENPIKQLKTIPKHTLLLYVHAYQSMLWNEVVASLEHPPETVPLVGFGTELYELDEAVRAAYEKVLEREDITTRDFIIKQIPPLSSEGDYREAIITVEDLVVGPFDDGVQTASFSLPKGSYATVLLEALSTRGPS